jgi:hypothetical protein
LLERLLSEPLSTKSVWGELMPSTQTSAMATTRGAMQLTLQVQVQLMKERLTHGRGSGVPSNTAAVRALSSRDRRALSLPTMTLSALEHIRKSRGPGLAACLRLYLSINRCPANKIPSHMTQS